MAVSWTFDAPFTNVGARIYGSDLFLPADASVTWLLTNAIGPSAKQDNVLWSGTSTYPAGVVDGAIFAGLNFAPGTYYLVISLSADGMWSPTTSDQTISAMPNVHFDGTLSPAYGSVNTQFAPASVWWMAGTGKPVGSGAGSDFNVPFTLTDNPDVLPEPRTPLLLVLVIVLMVLGSYRSRSRAA